MKGDRIMYEGKIVKILFQNDDSVIAILRMKNKEELKIIGSIYNLSVGDYIKVEGVPEHHLSYGRQIRVTKWEKPLPETASAVIKFLTSSGIKGIGPARAKKIYEKLGSSAIKRIIAEGPGLLEAIPGLKSKAQEIYEAILEKYEYQIVLQELLSLGFSERAVKKAYERFGSKTVKLIKANPYRLLAFQTVSFAVADRAAEKVGLGAASPERLQAALIQCFNNNYYKGHCYLNKSYLIDAALHLLNRNRQEKINKENVAGAIEESALFVCEGERVYMHDYYGAEVRIAEKVTSLCAVVPSPIDLKEAIRSYERNSGLILALKQKEAVHALFTCSFLILTGGPGTGKTETIRSIVKIYEKIYPQRRIALAAPTGRGARRLSEICGIKAQTLHKLVGMRPWEKPRYDSSNPLPYHLIIIDEASMMDLYMADVLFQAVAPGARVLMVGDRDQLPPVGLGQVLADFLKAGLPTVHLTEVFRQAAQSQVVKNAHNVLMGEDIKIDPAGKDFFHLDCSSPQKILELTHRAVARLIEKGYAQEDILVLTPMRKPAVGVNSLNSLLQEAFRRPGRQELKTQNGVFREGDKVIQNENDYDRDIYNGDIGVIEKVGPLYDSDGEVIDEKGLYVRFSDRTVVYGQEDINHLSLAYATTVHKAQGGETPAVVFVFSDEHNSMLTRNLLYTAITRAKEFVCLIGPQKALQRAVKNDAVYRKNTGLAEKIISLLEKKGRIAWPV